MVEPDTIGYNEGNFYVFKDLPGRDERREVSGIDSDECEERGPKWEKVNDVEDVVLSANAGVKERRMEGVVSHTAVAFLAVLCLLRLIL